jgi:hypothetical protein
MATLTHAALLALLLGLCSFAPGFLAIQRLRWVPLEKLCAAIACSLIFLFLCSWGLYVCSPAGDAGLDFRRAGFWAVSGACLVAAILARKQIVLLFRSPTVKRGLFGYLFLLLWMATILACIRNYSGLGWTGDWLEHFQRTLFFLHRFPVNTPIFGGYAVAARPPMMNVLAAFFLGQTQDLFWIFQIVFSALNVLVLLPCWLLLAALAPRGRRRIVPLVALLALNPVIAENATYSWTKSLTEFFVLLAIWFYLAAWRKRDSVRLVFAFVFLSAGFLVHYSAGPYLVILAGHYILFLYWKRNRPWRELCAIVITSGLLLATWFGWSIATYGGRPTFTSNTAVAASNRYQGNGVTKVAANLFDSIVPVALRQWPPLTGSRGLPSDLATLRDRAFAFYQVNLIFGMGIVGGPLIIGLVVAELKRRTKRPAERAFWLTFLPCCILLGIAVVGERDPFGSAHLTLLPLETLGLTLLAATFPWKRVVAAAILVGCLIDFTLGIWLHVHVESYENTPQKTVFDTALRPADGEFQPGPKSLAGLYGGTAWINWFLKHKYQILQRYETILAPYEPTDPEERRTVHRLRSKLDRDSAEDATLFQGWWGRHHFELTYLGDEIALIPGRFSVVLESLLCLLGVGLASALLLGLRRRNRPTVVTAAATEGQYR